MSEPFPPLIADTANTVVHVTAWDLLYGTAHQGPAWTKNGTVAYNGSDSPRPSVGGFTDANNFSLPGSTLQFASTFTAVVIMRPADITSTGVPFCCGDTLAFHSGYGFLMQTGTTAWGAITYGGGISYLNCGAYSAGAFDVFMLGWDGTSQWAQFNGGTPRSTVAGLTASAFPGYIGRNGNTGASFTGNVYEVYASTDAPSAAAFSALYTQVQQNLALPQPIPQPNYLAALSNLSASPQAVASLGLDISCLPDLDPHFSLLGGQQNLAQAIIHRLSTKRGLLPYAPNDGYDVRAFLNDSFFQNPTTATTTIQQAIEAEVERDSRVSQATAVVTLDSVAQTLTIALSVATINGQTFPLILSVGNGLTLQLLQGN